MAQISIFDGDVEYKINKPIRLIELFAGYGSQHLALKYLGAKVQSHRICEWAVKSIQAYKDLHFGNDNTDYSKDLATDDIIDFLFRKGISANYNEPMSREQIKRMGEIKCRQVYNNIKATHNFVNVTQLHACELDITDTDKYCYVMTYSFPCQDLSKAGKGKGMAKDSGTRSGLLWEVERILDECETLPQVLIMENVPDVIGTKNLEHFVKWRDKLENLGYKCYWQVLNGKNYGVPQNRDRCFMVSIIGDYYYEFPEPIPLTKQAKDILECNVDKKFYLSNYEMQVPIADNRYLIDKSKNNPRIIENANCITTREDRGISNRTGEGTAVVEPICIEIRTDEGIRTFTDNCIGTLRTIEACGCKGVIEPDKRVRKLTPRECWRFMGVKDEDFDKVSVNQSNSSLYHLAGDSIITDVLMAIFNKII